MDELPPMLSHLYHCIDYVRQSVLCKADLTLEGRSSNNNSHIDGYGQPKQCRNWVSLTLRVGQHTGFGSSRRVHFTKC